MSSTLSPRCPPHRVNCSPRRAADYTQNPFASTHSLDTNPFDDPASLQPNAPSPNDAARLEEIRRREQDLERQELKRYPSWTKLRKVVLWPREKGLNAARIILSPKSWDRKAIWHNSVVAPVGYLPAVILGLLLNILDALSYGT